MHDIRVDLHRIAFQLYKAHNSQLDYAGSTVVINRCRDGAAGVAEAGVRILISGADLRRIYSCPVPFRTVSAMELRHGVSLQNITVSSGFRFTPSGDSQATDIIQRIRVCEQANGSNVV